MYKENLKVIKQFTKREILHKTPKNQPI